MAALITTAIVLAVNLLMAFVFYGSEGLDCSILFAQLTYIEGSIPFNLTCGTLLVYQSVLAITGAIGVTGITLLFSAACKNQMIALVASVAVYALPLLLPVTETSALFRLIVLLPCTVHFPYVCGADERHTSVCNLGRPCGFDSYCGWEYFLPPGFCKASGLIGLIYASF
jgi:hypothetical protein